MYLFVSIPDRLLLHLHNLRPLLSHQGNKVQEIQECLSLSGGFAGA